MNNIKIQYIVLTITLGILLTTCSKEQIDNYLDNISNGLVINVDTDIFTIPIGVQFVNANPLSDNAPQNLKVSIEGPSIDQVYSPDGTKSVKVIDGFLEIAVDKAQIIDEENPVQLTFMAEADGFHPAIQTIAVFDTTYQLFHISMVDAEDLPEGASMKKSILTSSMLGVITDMSLETESKTDKLEQAAVTVKKWTRVFDREGNMLTGAIETELVHFDNRSEISMEAYPGGIVSHNVIGEDGTNIGPAEFSSAGFISLTMNVGGEKVKTFSDPIDITVDISDETIHPVTGAPIAVGDTIPVWSFDEDTGQWTYEGVSNIFLGADGKMKATVKATHLSWYSWGWYWWRYYYYNRCFWWRRYFIDVQSDFPTFSNAPLVYAQFVDARTGRRVGWGRYMWLVDGWRNYWYYAPINRNVRLQIYDSYNYYCRDLLYQSPAFSTTCEGTYDLELRGNAELQPRFTLNAEMSAVCEGTDNSKVAIKPYSAVYFKPTDCVHWSYLGYLYSYNGVSRFYTYRLEKGETYDFRVYYGGEMYYFRNVSIEPQDVDFIDYSLNIKVDEDRAEIKFKNLVLPAQFCKGILGG